MDTDATGNNSQSETPTPDENQKLSSETDVGQEAGQIEADAETQQMEADVEAEAETEAEAGTIDGETGDTEADLDAVDWLLQATRQDEYSIVEAVSQFVIGFL